MYTILKLMMYRLLLSQIYIYNRLLNEIFLHYLCTLLWGLQHRSDGWPDPPSKPQENNKLPPSASLRFHQVSLSHRRNKHLVGKRLPISRRKDSLPRIESCISFCLSFNSTLLNNSTTFSYDAILDWYIEWINKPAFSLVNFLLGKVMTRGHQNVTWTGLR